MSILKKVSSVALCAAMTLSLASCSSNLGGADTSYGAEIDGYKVPAGVFIAMQLNAYYDAMNYVEPTEETADETAETTAAETEASTEAAEETTTTAFTDKVIEGKSVEEWINDEATKSMQEYVAVENKFDELGLSFQNNEKEKATVYLDSLWEYYGSMYEDMGISKNSELLISLNSTKKSMIFDYYYGVGGEKEISEEEVKNYLTENNSRINYIKMELKDGEGNLLKSDGKAEIMEMAEGYVDRIKNGEDMNTVGNEYEKYYDALVEAAAETTDDGSEDTSDTAEETEAAENMTADYTAEASRLMGALDYIDKIGGGNIPKDEENIVDVNGRQFAKVAAQFSNIADLDSFMKENLSDSLIENRYSHILGGDEPYYVDIDGELYGYVTAKGCGYAWILENDEPVISIKDATDSSFTAVTKFDDFGGESEMELNIISDNGLWKISSIYYDGMNF